MPTAGPADVIPLAEMIEPPAAAAAELLEKAAKVGGADANVLYLLALACKRQGKIADARNALRKITPPDAHVILQLGLLSLQERNLAQAEGEFARAWEMDPSLYAAGHNLLMTRLTLGKLAECDALLAALRPLVPSADEQRFLGVLQALLQSARRSIPDREDGLAPLECAPAIVNLSAEDEQRLLRLVRGLGDVETACNLLRSLAGAHPHSPSLQEAYLEAALVQARNLLDRCRWGEAERMLAQLARDKTALLAAARPTQAAFYNLLGCCACMNQDFEGSVRYFNLALKLAGGDARVHQNLALAYEMQGELTQAEPHWNRYFDLLDSRWPAPPAQPNYVEQLAYEGLSRLAGKYSEKERWNSALTYAQRAHRLRPKDADTLERLFHLYNHAKRPQDARRVLKQLREMKPGEPQYELYELDLIDVKGLADIDRMLAEIERILKRYPGDARVEDRAVNMVGNVIPLMGRLCDQLTERMSDVIDQVRNVPSYQQVNWSAVREVMRDLQREFVKLRRITVKCLPLIHHDEHRRIIRDLTEHIDRKIEVCREMGA
jgi:Flp pilus assembly protein TadD